MRGICYGYGVVGIQDCSDCGVAGESGESGCCQGWIVRIVVWW